MNIEDALVIVDAVLPRRLTNVQEQLFRRTWEGKTYLEIAEESGYDPSYIRDVGYRLWQTLSKALGERVSKKNLQVVFRRYVRNRPVHVQGISGAVMMPYTNGLNSSSMGTMEMLRGYDEDARTDNIIDFKKAAANKHRDWGKAADHAIFFGRTAELEQLKHWVVKDRCHLVGIFGIGGIGKTAVAVKLGEQVQEDFDYLIWRSLRNAPPIQELLVDLIRFLSNQQETNLPTGPDKLLSLLMHYLQTSRCLLILDNVESVLQSGATAGSYDEGYEGYGEMFRQIGEVRHQSCLVITSREKLYEVTPPEGETPLVRSLQIHGLQEEARALFNKDIAGSDDGKKLIDYYRGHPLALQVVSRSIQELFDGDITEFLAQGTCVFSGIRRLLETQCNRLSALETKVMYWLAINREPISPSDLWQDIVPNVSRANLFEALSSLKWRSLIEKNGTGFTLQPVVMEYITEQLLEKVYAELSGQLDREHVDTALLKVDSYIQSYALIKAKSAEYVRGNQMRLIMQPLVDKLIAKFGTKSSLNHYLSQVLADLSIANFASGYGLDNIQHLLQQLDPPAIATANSFPTKVTEQSDLQILQRLLESDRPGGLATWDHRIPWANNPLAQTTSETKTYIRNKNLYYYWLEGALEELQQELKQQGRVRKRYCAWLNDTEFAEIDANFESVQITDTLNQLVEARLVFMNEVKIIQPPAGILTPPQRIALDRKVLKAASF